MSYAREVRFAARMLLKDGWFTALAVVVLSLGIAATTTVYTIVSGVFFADLPWRDASRLVHLDLASRTAAHLSLSRIDVELIRSSARSLSDIAAYQNEPANVADDRHPPKEYNGVGVSANTFALLGQPVLFGRDFQEQDSRPGAERVAILGAALWRSRYQGDPSVVGRVIRIDGRATTVVGVMPDHMRFPSTGDLWFPLEAGAIEDRGRRTLGLVGRLSDGVTVAQAQAEMGALSRAIAREAAGVPDEARINVTLFRERFIGSDMGKALTTLLGAVGFLLLIACGNVANLLLARSGARRREVAVRMALGATRVQVVRQLLIETLLLAGLAALIGLGISVAAVHAFDVASDLPDRPFWIRFPFDTSVFVFVAAITLLAALASGLAPALQVSGLRLSSALTEGGRGTGGGVRSRRLARAMVSLQLAMTVVLLTGAGLMVRSFFAAYQLDPGIRTDGLVVGEMRLDDGRFDSGDKRRRFYEELALSLVGDPAVSHVTYATAMPLGSRSYQSLELDLSTWTEADNVHGAVVGIGPRYFETLGISVRRGRAFDERDGLPGREVAIVNERFAQAVKRDPVGLRVRVVGGGTSKGGSMTAGAWLTIVGVSPTVRQNAATVRGTAPVVYVPARQQSAGSFVVLVRARGEIAPVAEAIRASVAQLDPDQAIGSLDTLDGRLADARWPYRTFGVIFSMLASLGLLMSGVGLFGLVAWSVVSRLQEIGVRMALGATRRSVVALFLGQAIRQVGIGLAVGLPLSAVMGLFLRSVLVQSALVDWPTLLLVSALLVAVMVVAAIVPARRAARVEPVQVLHAN